MERPILLSTFLFVAVLTPVLLQSNECSIESYPKLARLELYVPDINGQNVISDFNPDGILYKVELPLDPPDAAVLLVQAQDAAATVEVTYDSLPISLGPNGVAPLTLGPNHSEITVAVMADSKVWTYTVSIDRVDYCPCDDGNICTYNFCNQSNQVCEYPPVPDGSICANLKGVCYGGVCSFVPVSATIGPKEVVFDWTTDRCEDLDLPDGPARAVRMEDGEIVLFAGDAPTYYVSRGPDFNTLQRVCDPPALVSADSPTPETYENWEWIWAAYREGTSIHALIHNEFHDAVAPTCKVGDPSPANPCWYNSITYAVSTDGGHSFSKPGGPAHVVAPAHEVWTPPATPQPHGFVSLIGYHGPGNIVRGPDDYYYALILLTPSQYDASTVRCLMRTDTLNDPASWRAWDGTGFNDHMESPYVTGNPAVPTCAPLNVGGASLTYNSYLGQYMAVDNGGDPCGIYLWLSPDLIHWGRPQLITQARWWGCENVSQTPLEPGWAQYTAIIDHADPTPNFERPGRTPYLYYTRFNEGGGLDRDLVRVPLKFTMGGPLCDGVDCDDQNECTEDLCNGADGSCEHTPPDCADSNDCTVDTCNPTIGCEHDVAANGTPCGGGTCQAGVCTPTGYAQDFESLDQMSPTALSDDGWLISGTVFDDGGAFKFDYGPFDAPNLAGAFCDIDVGQGGSPQGDQQLVVYSDYGCCQPSSGHFPLGSGTDQVQSSVFQEPYPNNPGELIPPAAIGKTLMFSFDAKRGNINSPTDPSGKCDPLSPDYTTNPPCDSTALAYIQTLDPNAGFNRTNFVELDMTSLPFGWARYQISLDLTDPAL